MSGSDFTLLDAAAVLTFGLLLAGMVCCFVRMLRGPSLPDRVIALDLLTTLMVAFAGAYVVSTGEAAFLDVAIALALVGFLGTVAFARYAERRAALTKDPSPDGEQAACGNS